MQVTTYGEDLSNEVSNIIIGLPRHQCTTFGGRKRGERGSCSIEGGGQVANKRSDGVISGGSSSDQGVCRKSFVSFKETNTDERGVYQFEEGSCRWSP